MASRSEGDDGGIPLDIDNVHMLLQVEQEQIQKRTFTNWINAQLAKRCSPAYVSDLFLDLRDGSRLLDLLEVMSGQSMKRQRGRGVFQQRANIETALNFLKKKSIKLVNINIPDIIDGRPSIILGLVWTIILRCHIEELASALSFSSRHSSLDSVASLDSWSGSPIPASPVPAGRLSPLHRRFRVSAKKALLMWVRDQCKKVHCNVNVKNFKSSWRSGEAFLAILCALRPELVDLSRVETRSNQENLEEAFHLAERELHIPRLLEPRDVDVNDPDEKSIMTYVAQFLQYSNDMPSPDDHLQVNERAQDVQQAYQELSETWKAAEGSTYAEKYQIYEGLIASLPEQRRSVMRLFAATRRCAELNPEQQALRTAWERLEEELQKCEADLEQSLPPPLDSVVLWLQRGEAALKEEGGTTEDHAEAAKHARTKQDQLKTLVKEMNHYVKLTDNFHNVDESGNLRVPPEKLDDIRNRLTGVRVTAKYEVRKLEFEESRHTVLDLLRDVRAKVQSWSAPCRSQESVQVLLLDWHETVERHGLLLILTDALQSLKDQMDVYISKASLGGESQLVARQVKEAESEAELLKQKTAAAKETMDRVASAWDVYNRSLTSLEAWLAQPAAAEAQEMSMWTSCHARLNEVGNFLTEMTEASVSLTLVKQLSKVNMQWAERMKKTVFEILSSPRVGSSSLLMSESLIQEASLLMVQPLEVASVPLKAVRKRLQSMRTKMEEVDASCNFPSADPQAAQIENLQQTLLKVIEAERSCGELQRAASQLEGRVAELDHWSTEALGFYEQLVEKKHRGGHSALDSAAKALLSRGLQLAQQVVSERQHLEGLVAARQKFSPLQHLSTADMQDRTAASVSQSQEVLEKFSSCGFKQQAGDFREQTQPSETIHPETGSYVLARTKHVKQIVKVKLQTPELVPFPEQGTRRLQEERKGAVSPVEMKTMPQIMMVPVPKSLFPAQTKSPALSTDAGGPVTAGTERSAQSSHSQSTKHVSRTAPQPKPTQGPTRTPPPLMIHSEVHSKAQSMARSRLEKARLRLQGRIQQAMKLFGGREMTESQNKKKQKALSSLQPAMLDEFLGAVEAFGAFCSGPQLQDLMLLSDSVRNQWQDVRREMADFISIRASKIREVKPPFSVRENVTNAPHEAADPADPSRFRQDQQAVTQGATSVQERFEGLGELCETLTSRGLATDQQTEPGEVQKSQTSVTALSPKSRGRQLEVNTLLSLASVPPSSSLTLEQGLDGARRDVLPSGKAVHAQRLGDALQLRVQDVPSGNKDHLMQSQGGGREKKQKPSLRAKEQLLRARLLHVAESNQQAPGHIQAVVGSNTVESKQEAEWTVIPEPAVPPQEELPTEQDAAGSRMVPLKNPPDPMEPAGDQGTIIAERLHQISRRSLDISSLVLVGSTMFSALKGMDETLKDEMRRLAEQRAEEERRGPGAASQQSPCQPLGNVHHLEQLRQQLEEVQSTVRALDHFLATLRDIKAEIPALLAKRDPDRLATGTDQKEERHSWQATMERLKPAMEQSHIVDRSLKAVGMTLTMDGASVTCRDVLDRVSERMRATGKDRERELELQERKETQNSEDRRLMETRRNDSAEQDREHSAPSGTEEASMLEKRKQEGDDGSKMQKGQERKIQTWRSEEGFLKTKDQKQRSCSRHAGKDENEHESLVQRKSALLAELRETKAAAERLELLEPTLPALQQRTRALTELESSLAGLGSEVQRIRDASPKSKILENQTIEVEDLWEETTKATSDRLEQSHVLTDLLRRFQSMRGELTGTLQRAETTIGERASYVGKDYLQRLHTKVKETKAELNGLGDDIEEVRSICRQLQSLLRQVPGCGAAPFESEADALMDRWLDLSERTDSHLENLHLCLTLWDGVLQLGEEVESWTDSRIAVLSQCPSFQSEDDVKALKNEIMTQEESVQRFHRRASEIQSLLQSAEPPLELQVVETQMRKKIEQVKELVLESEEVYKQMVATMGQITERMMESFNSLQEIQDSLRSLSGSDVATILAKLKELCQRLHTEDERVQSLLEDVQVLASIASPGGLQSLSAGGLQLEESVRNTHQLFSEVEEQTERNIQHLDRLLTEKEQLDKWLCAAEENARKVEDLTLLQEEAVHQSGRTELIAELVSSLRSSNLRQSVPVEQSCKLLQRYHNFHTNIGGGSGEATPSLGDDLEGFQGLAESVQAWVEDLRQRVDSPLVGSGEVRTSAEQRLHRAQAVINATTDAEARLEELRVTGDGLSQSLSHREDLKQEVQVKIQKTEEQWRNLLESVQPHYRALHEDSELSSLYLTSRREACSRVEELQHQAEQLPSLFPWPDTAERAQACLVARQLQDDSESLKLTLTSLDEKRMELAEKTRKAIWKDSSWDELETRWSALMAAVKGLCAHLGKGLRNEEHFDQLLQDCHHHLTTLHERMTACQDRKDGAGGLNPDAAALEALLTQVTEIEKDLSVLVTLGDSLSGSTTAEAQASLLEQVGNLQNHKRAMERGIKEHLQLATLQEDERLQQVGKEASLLQTDLSDLAQNVEELSVLPDIRQLTQQWRAIQECGKRMAELESRVNDLQRTRETQETLPAGPTFTAAAVLKDLFSLRSIFNQKKEECIETTAETIRGLIRDLQQWNQAVQDQTSPSQVALDKGFQLQRALGGVLAQQNFLVNCLGEEVTTTLMQSASEVLNESQRERDSVSKRLIGHNQMRTDMTNQGDEGRFRSEERTTRSDLDIKAADAWRPDSSAATDKKDSDRHQDANTTQTKETFNILTEPQTCLSGASKDQTDATKPNRGGISLVFTTGGNTAVNREDALTPFQAVRSESPDVLGTSVPSSASADINPQTSVESKDDNGAQSSLRLTLSGNIAETFISSSLKTEALQRDCPSALVLELPDSDNPNEINTIPSVASLKETTEATIPTITRESEILPSQSERLDALKETHSESTTKVFTAEPATEGEKTQRLENSGDHNPDVLRRNREKEITEFPEKAARFSTASALKTSVKAAQSDPIGAGTDAGEQDGRVGGSPDKVFTIVLDLQPWGTQQSGYVGAGRADGFRWSQEAQRCNAKSEEIPRFPEKKSRISPALGSPGSHGEKLDSAPTPLALADGGQKGSSSQLESKENQTHEIKKNEAPTLSKSSKCEPCDERSAETTLAVSKTEATLCQPGGAAESPLLGSAKDWPPNRDETESEMLIDATVKQPTTADTATSAGAPGEGAARGGADDFQCTDGKHCLVPAEQESTSPQNEENKWKQDGVLKEIVLPLVKPQNPESMEPERTPPAFLCGPGAGETTGGSPGSHSYRSTLLESLSDIQGSVEQSNIIGRKPHVDLKRYLTFSPGDADIRLARTVQHVLACRYQPARLDAAAMAKQLEEAREHLRSVEEQVAAVKSSATKTSDPKALERAEGEWSSVLLDASATVQVKAAQLDQVKKYHLQKKITRAFLQVIAAEKEKMSLNALGSSFLQIESLHALLQTMEQKESMMEDLLCLSSQLSVHLSDEESSGVLPAQLAEIQEEWRLLKGSIQRAHRQASNSGRQSKLILREAGQLKANLDALLKFETDNLSPLDVVCLTADLKGYYLLYLQLQSQADALIRFPLGQKEKAAIEENLCDLKSFLGVVKKTLDSLGESCGNGSTGKISKQVQDLIPLTKQAENHVFSGKRLSVFPQQASLQIDEMRKIQMEALSRRSEIQTQVEELKSEATVEKRDHDVSKTLDLYETVAGSLNHVLDTMKKGLDERERILCEFARLEGWAAEAHVKRESCGHVENVSKADLSQLESELKSRRSAMVELETQLKLMDALSESCTKLANELSPAESRYLVNRLSGLWLDLDGLLAHEKASCWELEELIHGKTSSNEELCAIQANLEQISADLEKQKFPLTKETLSVITQLELKLMEHQWEVQELQHCEEDQRNSVLCSIGDLQDRCKVLRINAVEQDKYLHLVGQTEGSMDIAKRQIQEAKHQSVSIADRFRLCQTLLVELALVNTQCQEAADQLEAIADELQPSELNSEREKLQNMVETLISWEHSVTDDIENLEAELLPGLRFTFELPALMELLQRAKRQLAGAKQAKPDEKAIDDAMLQCWVIRRNVESGLRVLKGLVQKDNVNLEDCNELYSLGDAVMQECNSWMVSLSEARESLKDYQWAAQGATRFLHNAEASFLSAPGGFSDCAQEQIQTQQTLEVLADGFQAYICHLVEKVPQKCCLSWPETELLHISVLSQLLVGRAVLEAQAKLRLECLQRCEVRQETHKKWHEGAKQEVSHLEAKLSECASEQVTSYDECITQEERAKVLTEDLRDLAGKMADLRAGCPVQGCGVGKDGELGALWRRWTSLRRGVGVLLAHTEQRGEEWMDITASMEESWSFLAGLQAELPDPSTVSFSQEEPQELLALVEQHQAGLEQEQEALLSLEHQLEHASGLSFSQGSSIPGPNGKALEKIQESIRSLKERNLLLMAAAEEEEKERQQVQGEIEDVEKKLFAILPELETSSNPSKIQLQEKVISLKSHLKRITDSLESRYTEIPTCIRKKMLNVGQSVQKAEEMLLESDNPIRKLSQRVRELGSGLERVTALLEQKSPTIREAQHVLKCVWDELDAWHSSLMLLECEVQDLAEDQPDDAQLLMDRLTEPSQLYQNASRMAENRTAFLSKIPACLQEFEDISHRASGWLDEAQSWLSTPCMFTTAKSLHNHVKHLQLVLEDSERIRRTLKVFKSVLAEISAVCDISAQEEKLDERDQQVQEMQQIIAEPLDQLQEAVAIVEVVEADIKAMEKNVSNIKTVLHSMDNAHITQAEHLQHREAILTQIQSMQKRLEDLETGKGEIHLPEGAENLVVFSKARLLVDQLDEVEEITREQMSLLENKREEEITESLDIMSVSDSPEEMLTLENPAHRRFFQEDFEVTYSDKEEDEGDESCHSSSSDTLTGSIPEDLEEMVKLSDEQREDMSEIKPQKIVKEMEGTAPQAENCSEEPAASVLGVKPGLHDHFGSQNTETGSPKVDLRANICQIVGLETVTKDELTDEHITTAAPDLQEASKQEIVDISPQINSSLVEATAGDTRLIPSRPVTPFCTKKASDELRKEENDLLSLSPADLSHPDALNRLKEQKDVSPSPFSGLAAAKKHEEIPEAATGSLNHEDDDVENQRRGIQCTRIPKKRSSLKTVLEEQQNRISTQDGGKMKTVPGENSASTGSTSSALQQIRDANALLRLIIYEVKASGSSPPGLKKRLHEAVQRVLLCLDSSTDLLTHEETLAGDPELRLLQQECLSAQLLTLTELLTEVESQVKAALLPEESDAHSCLTSLQDYRHKVQLLLASSCDQLIEPSGPQNQHQTLPANVSCLLDAFDTGDWEIFPDLNGAPSLECALGGYLRASTGGKEELQLSSQSLLQGMSRLLKQGEESLTEKRTSQIPNRSKLQAVLCRHKKLLQVLGSQLSFLQYLFQREPDALESQKDEWVHLEVRAKALQQQVLEEEIASQRRLQDWIRWERRCDELGRVLDESEAFISSGESEGGDEDEMLEQRLHVCKQTLLRLDESRAVLGTLQDLRAAMQAEPWFATTVGPAGGALELRWKAAFRRTEQEITRLRKIQEGRARFQTDFTLVSERLLGASKHLKTLSDLADSSDLSQESVHRSLVELLDLSMELEATSAQRESVSKEATRLLHLREADCPGLRGQISQLEANSSQLTSDLSKTLEHLLQRLVAAPPPVKLLSELENWLKQMETRLRQEKEGVLKAENAAKMAEILQHCQALRTPVNRCQQLLDFMSQPGSKMAGADTQARRLERTSFAENLGRVRLQWLLLQRELDSQIHEVERIHHTCAERERHLRRLHGWTEQQKKRLNEWKRPTGQTVARSALVDWEADVGRIKEVSAALQELKNVRAHYEKEEKLLCDVIFSDQAESVSRACGDLYQQMEDVRPALGQTVEKWTCFQRALGEVALYTTRVCCALQHQHGPLFTLQQAEGYSDLLQDLQAKVEAEGEQLWTALDKSHKRLVETLQDGSAQPLSEQVEEQRIGWKDMLREIREEHKKISEIFSLWREYANLSEGFCHRLQRLRSEWEELSGSPSENEPDASICSLKRLQAAADELQSNAGDVLAASKGLLGRLPPLSADLIKCDARLLTRDILLLNQEISGKKRSLVEDLEQESHGTRDADTLQQALLEFSDVSSLVDIKETSGDITIDNEEMEKALSLNRPVVKTQEKEENEVLQDKLQSSLDFQEKCEKLKSIQENLERESECRKALSYSNLQEMLAAHQKLQAEVVKGHQLLQGLLCDAVKSMEKETEEKRSELMVRVACLKKSWSSSVALAAHNWTLTKQHLQQWKIYHYGLKSLKKMFRKMGSFLPPTGPCLYTLQQLQNCTNLYQLIEESLELHSSVYTRTVEAGKHLSEIVTESESRNQLQSELRDLQKVWEQTALLQRRNKDLVNSTVQMWSRSREAVSTILSGLDKVSGLLAERPEYSEEEARIQETELSLQRSAGGLRELATMKTDLSQYVAASDSALLEQQLELLHAQWEELCMKVSLRKQEIADRLNAWTIFNDKSKEFCDWLTQMENKVCHSTDLSIEEMVEKLKKDCMEEINLFSENKSHLKQLGEQLLLASDEAKQTQVCGSLQEVNQRWHNLFQQIEARVKKLKETLVTVQQLDKNMSNLRSWLSRIQAELSRPITYSVCHEREIQRRLGEQQELQRDIEQHTEGVASVLSLCDVLLQDADAAGGAEAESDSLQETSRSLDQRWRTICALALERRLRIEETWTLWCKFLNDYSRFEDWLKMAERTAANPNSADVLYSVAREELKKFEGFQRQVHERLTQLELINNQYRRLARENRTDRASQLKAMVREGNQRWDSLHRRVAAILRRLKHFTGQREEFEGTRESMLVWLTELDLQLTNVEHFSESDVHQKIQQLNSFQKEITLNTERIDGLIVFGEALIQKSSPQDAALMEDELEELHSYCQEVFSRLVRFHQRLCQPPMIKEEPDISDLTFSLESSLELIGRPWLGRSQASLPATPTHLLSSPLERSGRETPVSVDSLPLEWDHTGDVGGSSSHEDDEEEEEHEDGATYFSALSVSSRSMAVRDRSWMTPEAQLDPEGDTEPTPALTSTPLKQGYLRLVSQCSDSIENIKRVSLILDDDDEEQPEEFGLTGLNASDKQSGVIERWELRRAQSRSSPDPQQMTSDLDKLTSWLESVVPELDRLLQSKAPVGVEEMEARAKELKEMEKAFCHYKAIMLSVNLQAKDAPELQGRVARANRDWSRACTGLQQWDHSLRKKLIRCQEFHSALHSLLLWLAQAESRCCAVDTKRPETSVRALQQQEGTLRELREELRSRQAHQASLQALWSQLQPKDGAEDGDEAQEKLHVTGSKLRQLRKKVEQDLGMLQQRLLSQEPGCAAAADPPQEVARLKAGPSTRRQRRESSPPRSFFSRLLRAAFPVQLLLLLLLLLPCLIPLSEIGPGCTVTNNFARSFYPMLHYTNGPPPT